MRTYKKGPTRLPTLTEAPIYRGILEFCRVNGIERFAAEISKLATVALFHENTAKVYSGLTSEYQSTGEISKKVGVKSNDVSSILAKLHKETTLISVKNKGRLKHWAKT